MQSNITATPQQQAFVDALVGTKDNIALVARAGTGKTSTILLGVAAYHAANPEHEVLVCAFNKPIADEVSGKLKERGYDWKKVQASTVHAMGFGLVRWVFKGVEVEDKKVRNLIKNRNEPIFASYGSQIAQLVKLAKGEAFGFFTDSQIGDLHAWYRIADHYGVNGLDDTSEMDKVVEAAQMIYRLSLEQTNVIDYDDMILFPLVKNLRVKFTKDLILVDESQDLSRARQALIRKFVKPVTGRMVIIGDDRQAIYGFSGADAAALQNLTQSLKATTFPLTVTWRCPKAVVAEAQKIVPDILAADNAIDGEVLRVEELPADLDITDAILCRNTAPLVEIAYKLIRSGKACKVEGKQIGEGLVALAKRWKVTSIVQLLQRLETFRDREVQKALAKDQEQKATEITDRVQTLVEICNACLLQEKYRVADVEAFINDLFADGAENVIILATYHRSKGREWSRVFLWEHTSRCPSRGARLPWQQLQEKNLAYVAITRAKEKLVYVN